MLAPSLRCPSRLLPQGMAAPGEEAEPTPLQDIPPACWWHSTDSWPAPALTFSLRSRQLSCVPSTGLCLWKHLCPTDCSPAPLVGWDRPGHRSREGQQKSPSKTFLHCKQCQEHGCESQGPGWTPEPSMSSSTACSHVLAAMSSGRGGKAVSPSEPQNGSPRSPVYQHPELEGQGLRLQLSQPILGRPVPQEGT